MRGKNPVKDHRAKRRINKTENFIGKKFRKSRQRLGKSVVKNPEGVHPGKVEEKRE